MGFVSIFVCWFVCKPELCVGVCAPCLNCGFHSCLNSDPTWGFCKPWVSVWVCALCLSFGLNSRLNCGSKLGFGSCCFVCLQAYKQIHTSSPSCSPAPRSVDWVCVSWGLCLFCVLVCMQALALCRGLWTVFELWLDSCLNSEPTWGFTGTVSTPYFSHEDHYKKWCQANKEDPSLCRFLLEVHVLSRVSFLSSSWYAGREFMQDSPTSRFAGVREEVQGNLCLDDILCLSMYIYT